jgi:hypothetical protein
VARIAVAASAWRIDFMVLCAPVGMRESQEW